MAGAEQCRAENNYSSFKADARSNKIEIA